MGFPDVASPDVAAPDTGFPVLGTTWAFSGTPSPSRPPWGSAPEAAPIGLSSLLENSERTANPSALSSSDTAPCMAGSSSVIQVASSALRKRPFSLLLRARMI